jgi:hypothetical protein
MRHARKAVGLGWRALLALGGGVASLAGCGGNEVVMYGVQACTQSPPTCATGNYCAKDGICYPVTDGGTTVDAGK